MVTKLRSVYKEKISKTLFEKLEAARDTGNSQDMIYQAMLVGKSEAQEDIRLDY